MSDTVKNRAINAAIGLFTGVAVVLFSFILDISGENAKALEEEIRSKPSKEYVDKQDVILKELIIDTKNECSKDQEALKESIHRELDGINNKLDILINKQ